MVSFEFPPQYKVLTDRIPLESDIHPAYKELVGTSFFQITKCNDVHVIFVHYGRIRTYPNKR